MKVDMKIVEITDNKRQGMEALLSLIAFPGYTWSVMASTENGAIVQAVIITKWARSPESESDFALRGWLEVFVPGWEQCDYIHFKP